MLYKGKVGQVIQLHGLSPENLVKKLGEPKTKEKLNLKDGLHEYQIELNNLFKGENPDVEVTEWYYFSKDQEPSLHLYVWFHDKGGSEKAIYSLIHDDGTMF